MLKNRPWFDHYANVPHSIDYPGVTMYESVMQSATRVPDKIAWDFMGTLCSYKKFAEDKRKFHFTNVRSELY